MDVADQRRGRDDSAALSREHRLSLDVRQPERRQERRFQDPDQGDLDGCPRTVYAVWLLYAAGPQFLLMSTILFVLGLPVFWYAQRERDPAAASFTGAELVAAVVLVAAAATALVLFAMGVVQLG